jgi:hypothetical protein
LVAAHRTELLIEAIRRRCGARRSAVHEAFMRARSSSASAGFLRATHAAQLLIEIASDRRRTRLRFPTVWVP